MRNVLRTLLILLPFVAAALQPADIRAESGQIPFIRTEVTNTEPYAGEEVLLTYTLCFTGEGPRVSDASNPSLKGLWAEELDPGRFVKSRTVIISGVPCRSALIRQFKLAPLKSGRYVIDGYRLNCLMPETSPAQESKTLTLTAPAVVLQAKKLPEPVPEGFSGAVGTFSFTLDAEPATLRAGEPVTLTATVKGRGNLPSIIIPLPDISPSVHRGSAVTSLYLDKDTPLSSGSHRSRVTLYPEEPGTLVIPEVRLISFDPSAGLYRTTVSGPISVAVLPGEVTENVVSNQIQHKETPEIRSDEGPRILPFAGIVFVLLIALGVLFIIVKTLSGKKRSKTSKVPGFDTDGSDSPDMLRNRIYAAVTERGIAKPESLTKKQLSLALRKTGISEKTAEKTERLLDMIDRSLYSPLRPNEQELIETRRKTALLISELRQPKSPAREEVYR